MINTDIQNMLNLKEDIVNIIDILEFIYSDSEKEIGIIKLIGSYIFNLENKVTLNSPIGKAIYKKK